jgi:hypothetical protein
MHGGKKPNKLKKAGPQPLRKRVSGAQTYVVTYAQNATPVHTPFLQTLENYCRLNDAVLVIIPGRYQNPTSIYTEDMEDADWWADETHPYLFSGRKRIGGTLTIYGDISIQPTAERPLTGFEAFAGTSSAIFGHPKLQLTAIPTAGGLPRILTTTGAVTIPNYTPTKAGKKGLFHHILGATVVEQGKKGIHLRQINATSDGCFTDLNRCYTSKGSSEAPRALGLYCGDIHDAYRDDEAIAATFTGPDSIVGVLRPEKIIYGDVLHFDARNHHTIGDFCDRYERAQNKRVDNVENECLRAIAFIDDMTPVGAQAIVLASNHDEAFDRWLNEANPKVDPKNARFYHRMWVEKIERYENQGRWTPAFEIFYNMTGRKRARFLSRDEEYRIGDILVSCHGDEGPNGAIGTRTGFAKMGSKTIIGHGHSPGVLDGCYQVGVKGKRDQGYNNTLLSGWLNTDCVIYANKKRCLISVVKGEWRGSK